MHIVIAPDSFKGSVSAYKTALAMESGVLRVFPDAKVSKIPIADGGEGTVEALVTAAGGKMLTQRVTGPLGELVEAVWGLIDEGRTAVIEMAAASGLTLVPKDKRNPLVTTTYGTGQLMAKALDAGVNKIIIGIGGSATNDGGTGMAKALGVKFLDAEGRELAPGGGMLRDLKKIDSSGLDKRLQTCDIMVACDVDNPLCGVRGASAVFGPQKGATPAMIEQLDEGLRHYAALAAAATGRDMAEYPGAGAAGGLGAGLLFFTGASLRPGVQIVLESVGFAQLMRQADLVITGEGCTDFQTAYGKAPVGVAKMAKACGVPVVCLSGGLGKDAETVLTHGIDALSTIVPGPLSLEECMAQGEALIAQSAERLCRLLAVGAAIAGKSL